VRAASGTLICTDREWVMHALPQGLGRSQDGKTEQCEGHDRPGGGKALTRVPPNRRERKLDWVQQGLTDKRQ
jgi:hypothetical protein